MINWIDIIFGIFLLYGGYKGYRRGLILELASLLSILLGVVIASKFSSFLSDWLYSLTKWDIRDNQYLTFFITFMVVLIGVGFVGKVLTKILGLLALGLVNRIAGGLFGGLKFVIVLSVIYLFVLEINTFWHFIDPQTVDNSAIHSFLKAFDIQQIKDLYNNGNKQLEHLNLGLPSI